MNDLISRTTAIIRACSKIKDDGVAYDVKEALLNTPSAEPKIIRCKDCKWKQGSECVRFADVRPFPDDFCSRAERRTDEADYRKE